MHYIIKKDKRMELQSGYSVNLLTFMCGCSRQYLSNVLNGNRKASKLFVERLINSIADMSLKMAVDLNTKGMEKLIKYFLKKLIKIS